MHIFSDDDKGNDDTKRLPPSETGTLSTTSLGSMNKPRSSYANKYTLFFPRTVFLRAVCAVYAIAFASIGEQIPGLYGTDGLEPVDQFLTRLKARNPRLDSGSFRTRMAIYPTLVWLHEELQWPPSLVMQVLALVGLTIALLGAWSPRWRTTAPLLVVWLCYLSIVQCGQTFMQFQWDSFLLEVGFLAIGLAPWWAEQQHPQENNNSSLFDPPASVVWTLRFLFFKFMLMSGAVKIQSACPTWLGLTALQFHFATQPLPLPLSWYAHQLPPVVLSLGVAATLLFEGPWAFLILVPSRGVRQFSAAMQILLQVLIMLTGNYNFFNILTTLMAFALMDERVLSVGSSSGSSSSATTTTTTTPPASSSCSWNFQCAVVKLDEWWQTVQQSFIVNAAMVLIAVVYCWYSAVRIFTMGYDEAAASIWGGDDGEDSRSWEWESALPAMWIRFTPMVEDTQAWLARILPVSITAAALIFVAATVCQLATTWVRPGCRQRSCIRMSYLVLTALISAWVFCSSVVTLSILDRPFQQSLPTSFLHAYETTSHFRITSAYGLFRTMTGVGTYQARGTGVQPTVVARPEIIIEGTDDHGATWRPYHFRYKPGDVEVAPRMVVPFQPRLDWQMWFAALGDYQGAPWIVHLVDKLLKGSRDVKALLDPSRDPFPRAPPHAIRANLYFYDYTRLNTTWNRLIPTAVIVNDTSDANWWSRTFYKEYLPSLEHGIPSLQAFVNHHFGRENHDVVPKEDCSMVAESPAQYWSCRGVRQLVAWPRCASVLLVASSWLFPLLVRIVVSLWNVAMCKFNNQIPKAKME